jgi:hypothetical protein
MPVANFFLFPGHGHSTPFDVVGAETPSNYLPPIHKRVSNVFWGQIRSDSLFIFYNQVRARGVREDHIANLYKLYKYIVHFHINKPNFHSSLWLTSSTTSII